MFAVLAASSCKSQYDTLLSSNDVDTKYKAAFDYFNKGKYQKSAALFESMSVLTDGTERDDTVQYYWGLSNYRYKDYVTAEANFNRFVNNFPRSPFAEEARFLRIDCLYKSTYRYELDQAPTKVAIASINEYEKDYGSNLHKDDCDAMLKDLNGRLDRKAFEGARLYYNMEDYKAARVAFRNTLKANSEISIVKISCITLRNLHTICAAQYRFQAERPLSYLHGRLSELHERESAVKVFQGIEDSL